MRGGLFAQREIVQGAVSQATPAARLVFLRKVYALFLLGLGIAGLGGWVGTQTGIAYTSPGLLLIGYIVTFFVCQSQRRVYPLNIALFGLFTFISGLLISPLIAGQLLGGDTKVLVQALGLTTSIFGGLTIYTLTSRSDFSYLGGALSIGLFGLIGFMIIGWFTGGFAPESRVRLRHWSRRALFGLCPLRHQPDPSPSSNGRVCGRGPVPVH